MNSINEGQQRLIDRYLQGQLSKEDAGLLNQYKKEDNRVFFEELRFQEAIKSTVKKHPPNNDLKALLNKEAKQIREKVSDDYLINSVKKERFRVIRNNLSIAASLLLLISVGGVFWANSRFSAPAIAASLVEVPMENSSMSEIQDITALSKGKDAFFKGAYEEAKQLLLRITPTASDTYYEAQVFLAYIYFEQKKYEESIYQFDQLLDKDFDALPNTYKNQNKLRWNRLLAHVGNHQTETTFFKEELFFFLNNKSNFYQQKANQLQARLNSPWRKIVIE